MQGAEDHLQRGFARKLGVGVDRDAAPVVAHDNALIGPQFDLDTAGMAGHGLIHRVVQDLGDKMVQGALIGAPDIHAGSFAYRLQPLENLDG